MPRSINDAKYNEFRAQAKTYNKKRSQCMQQSQQAFKRGDKQRAKALSNEGKNYKSMVDKENKLAAKKIFNFHNSSKDNNEIDLHGLYVPEAIDRLTQRVEIAKKTHQSELIVIVGRGIHSQGGPKIKPAVIKYANTHKIKHKLNSPNAGCITFTFEDPNELPQVSRSSRQPQISSTSTLEPVHFNYSFNRPAVWQPSPVIRYPGYSSEIRTESHTVVNVPSSYRETYRRNDTTAGNKCKIFLFAAVFLGIFVGLGKVFGFF